MAQIEPAPGRPHQHRWNFVSLLIHQVLFRIAWIFKTESVVMPAFLDTVVDSGFARGALPLLNRVGQSLAPLMLSDRLTAAPRKSKWLSRTTFLMGIPFLFLGACVRMASADLPPWFAAVFLFAYATFFCVHGVNDMTVSTVLGKLIPADRRGRLQALGSTIGTIVAILLAVLLLSRWLKAPGQAPFEKIFFFVGSAMMLAGIWARSLRETPDHSDAVGKRSLVRIFTDASDRLKCDAVLRRLCLIAVLFISSQIIFPHYQRLGLSLKGASASHLMDWVIAQHIGAAIFSSAAGLLADRFGTRSALRMLVTAAVLAPLLAIGLAATETVRWYWMAFFWIGLVPVTLRMQVNYALEIVDRSQHPAYISTLNLCMALPFLFAPLVGGLVQAYGFTFPFSTVALVVAVSSLLTWTMKEPRGQSV